MLGGLRQESFHVPQRTCLFDMELIFELTDSSLRGMIAFCRDLFEPDSMLLLARHLERLLATLVADPATPIDRIAWPLDGLPVTGA